MRCKQLLIVLLLGCTIGAVASAEAQAASGGALAADSQLKAITVSSQAGATVVALETAGVFTHSEYRPQPSMVLVDLRKVSSSSVRPRQQSVNLPGVKSYRVLEYKSVNGVEVTRVEFTVSESVKLRVKESSTGLQLFFSDGPGGPAPQRSAQNAAPAASVAPAPKPAAVAAKPAAATPVPVAAKPVLASEQRLAVSPVKATKADLKGAPLKIRHVSVVRTSAGMAVEIEGVKSAKTLRLSAPERLVLDIENAVAEGSARTIPVNTPDLKAVRIAQHQLDPPVTRIVLDLEGPREFDVASYGNKLVVTVLPTKPASQLTAAPAGGPVSAAVAPPGLNSTTPPAKVAPAALPVTTQLSLPKASQPKADTKAAPSAPTVSAAVTSPGLNPATPPAKVAPAALPVVTQPSLPKASQPEADTKAAPSAPTVSAVVVPAVKESNPANAQPQLKTVAFQPGGEQPGGASKAPDFVVVEPAVTTPSASAPAEAKSAAPSLPANAAPASSVAADAKQGQDSTNLPTLVRASQPAPTPASAAVSPAGVRAVEAASTIAQNKPPEPPAKPQPAPGTPQPAVNLALEQQRASAAPASPQPPARKYSGEPISVNLKDVDLKDFFRLIHEISGLNIVLDPGVKGTVTLVLDDVPWDQALEVVLQNNGLGRQLEGNVLRIANLETLRKEANEQRAHAEAQALAVNKVTVSRFLSYAHAKDLVPTLKKLLSPRGDVLADERTNALIISDIPSVIPNLDRLITQLDRKTLEVEIEARVVAATRTFARQLGSQVGFGWGNGKGTSIGGNPAVGTSPNTVLDNGYGFPYFTIPGPSTGGSPTAQAIPLFSNLGVSGSPTSGLNFMTAVGNYRLDILLSAAESRGLLKILSRPRIVTQNNITAVVRQGYRLPIVTQSQLGGPPTTSYIDAFLRLTVTPQITVENTIFLAVDVENTVPDNSIAVQGNPGLATQQATTQVLVTDGGTVMIGGVIQTTNAVTVTQVPFLGNVPILGNIFKNRSVQTQTQELIFFLTPKIIQT